MKRKPALLLLLTSASLLLNACSSGKPELEKLQPAIHAPIPKPVPFSSFWEAMENMDFSYQDQQPPDSWKQQFAGALKLIENGDIASAENEFRKICATTEDPAVKKHSAKILQSLLFYQSRWNDLLQLSQDPGFGNVEDRALAEAYSKARGEIYMFPAGPVELPVSLSNTGSPIVPVVVNGKPRKFWLDTGASVSVVASDVAAECGVRPATQQEEQAQTATSRQVTSRPAIISELKIGAIRIQNHPAVILRKEDLEFKILGFIRILKVDGILGWNAIQNMDIELNYRDKRAIFRKPNREENTRRNFFWIGYPVVTARAENARTLRFGLDTGANASSIRENIFKKIPWATAKTEKLKSGSAGGWETRDAKVLSSLMVDVSGYRIRFKDISTHPSDLAAFIKLDGILGSDIAHNGKVRLDITNGRFELAE